LSVRYWLALLFAAVLLAGTSPAFAARQYFTHGSCVVGETLNTTAEGACATYAGTRSPPAASWGLQFSGISGNATCMTTEGNTSLCYTDDASTGVRMVLADYIGLHSNITVEDMSTPVHVTTCSSACTVTFQLEQKGQWTFAGPQFFELSVEDGGLIEGAVLAVWALAWGFRAIVRTIKETDGNPSTSED